jgi:hypothetical protein
MDERDRDTRGVAIPRPEVHLVVRFGPSVSGGLDVHAMGGRKQVLRKLLHNGQRLVMARLHLGSAEAVLGVPASAITGRVVPLEDLWGAPTTRRLVDRFASARDTREAAAILEGARRESKSVRQARTLSSRDTCCTRGYASRLGDHCCHRRLLRPSASNRRISRHRRRYTADAPPHRSGGFALV